MSDPTSAERKQLLETELTRYTHLLRQRADIDQVIVFGSVATGRIHAWSDIDLVVVKESNLPFLQRVDEIRDLLQPRVGTDIFVYTPGEFEQLGRERPFVREEIVSQGIILYERDRQALDSLRA